jgi:hypothetical protein
MHIRRIATGFLAVGLGIVMSALPVAAAQVSDHADLSLLPRPRRLVDTQPGSGYQGAGQPLRGLTDPRCYQVAGQVGVPADAVGVIANVTAVGFSVNGWITLFAAGDAIPDTSNLNFDTDQYAVANMAMVRLGSGGGLCAVGQPGTHLILDVIGYLRGEPVSAGLTCPTASTLDTLLSCVLDQSGMRDRSGGYVVPSAAERADFRLAARALLRGTCSNDALGATLARVYRVRAFTDVSTNRQYCVLMEVGDVDANGRVDKGWGTFIVDNNATRELNIAVAHPFDDARTQDEGLAIFRDTTSRSFLLAGARRDLGEQRTCPGEDACAASDVAHNTDTMFYAVTEELADFYGATDWTQLQFHGNRSCPETDIHLSYGIRSPRSATDKLSMLETQLLQHHPDWLVTAFGEPGERCALDGTTNVEGQLLNDGAPDSQRRFLHIEQYMDDQRTDRRDANNWTPVIVSTFSP